MWCQGMDTFHTFAQFFNEQRIAEGVGRWTRTEEATAKQVVKGGQNSADVIVRNIERNASCVSKNTHF